MVERVEKLAQETVSVYLSEVFRKTLTKGQWDRGILFYLVHLYKDYIPSQYLKKVLSIVSKNSQYIGAEAMERYNFPFETFKDLNSKHYVAILGTRKGKLPSHEKTIGHLFHYSREISLLIGIWPLENRFHFQDLSEKDIKKKIIDELKLFTKPKLWESVLVLLATP